MSGGLVWQGLDEYRDELRRLPDACHSEAAKLIEGGVNGAFVTIAAVYGAHRFTGTLRNRLTIRATTGGLVLTSGSPLAWLFDNGSRSRHWKKNGKWVGRMPPTHIFSGTVGRARRRLIEQFTDMLLRHGATRVTAA